MATPVIELGLPFFFMLAVVYGALQSAGVFEKRGVNIIISVVIAAFSITNATILTFVNAILVPAIIFFIIVFFVSFALKPFKGEGGKRDWTLIIIIIALLFLGISSYGSNFSASGFLGLTQETLLTLGGLILIVAIILAAYRKGGEGEGRH